MAAALLVAAACADGETSTTRSAPASATAAPDASLAASLVDRSFVGEDLTDDGEKVELARGTTLHLTFTDATRLTASAGCNSMSGGWSIEGTTLVVDDLATTQMACEASLMDQDARFAELLTGRPIVVLDGASLTLHEGVTTVRMADDEGAQGSAPLVGTRWEITNIVELEGDESTSVTWASGSPGSLWLDEDLTYELDTPCVVHRGGYTLREDRVVLSVGEAEEHDCEDPDPALTEAVDALLLQGATATIDGRRLELDTGEVGIGLDAEG